jgi:4-azaleucine resistance transporter AzlC
MSAVKQIPGLRVSPEYWRGIADSLPVLLGIIPFGITYGVVGLAVGLTPGETLLMSLFVFAGAAQFICTSMIGLGIVDFSLIVFTTLLINLRHLLMGASLTPFVGGLPLRRQALLAFGMADETYAITMDRIQKSGYNESYQLGSNSAGYVIWAASTLAGIFLGKYIPDPLAWGLDFAMPATFLAMLIPRLVNRTSVIVCLVAAIVAVFCAMYLPGKWYIIIACVGGSLIGGLLEGDGQNAA